MVNQLINFHCHHSQRAYALSESDLLDSFHLGCGIDRPSLAKSKDREVSAQADVIRGLVVGEADELVHRMLTAHDKTLEVQRVAGVLVDGMTVNRDQKTIHPELGATRVAHREPFSRKGRMLRILIMTDYLSLLFSPNTLTLLIPSVYKSIDTVMRYFLCLVLMIPIWYLPTEHHQPRTISTRKGWVRRSPNH